MPKEREEDMNETCKWSEEDYSGLWNTDCGNLFDLNEGTPSDNGMKFCCYCGKLIEQVVFED